MAKLPKMTAALLAATMTFAAATPVVAQGPGRYDDQPGAHGNGGPGNTAPATARTATRTRRTPSRSTAAARSWCRPDG